VEWSPDWPRVRPWEVASAAVLTIGDTLFEVYVPISSTRWRGGILFDDWARSVFYGSSLSAQSTASTVSDILYKGGTLAPFVVDVYLVTLSIHGNVDVAWQLLVMDLQSLSLAGLISLSAEHLVGRARPYTDQCGTDGYTHDGSGSLLANQCGTPNDNRSFFSGHVTSVATMAGLTCAHHQHIPLYGGGFADLAPCLTMMAAAAATGVLRLTYDEHWATDVVTAWGVGAVVGYVLPSVLHYGFGDGHAVGEIHARDFRLVPTLQSYQQGGGLGIVGTF
jgi:hypothetical protein